MHMLLILLALCLRKSDGISHLFSIAYAFVGNGCPGGRTHTYFETIASLPGFGMAPEGHLSYSFGPNIRTGRTKPCLVRVGIDPIPPKELRLLPTCHPQKSSLTVAP